jgi:hypothetical protein
MTCPLGGEIAGPVGQDQRRARRAGKRLPEGAPASSAGPDPSGAPSRSERASVNQAAVVSRGDVAPWERAAVVLFHLATAVLNQPRGNAQNPIAFLIAEAAKSTPISLAQSNAHLPARARWWSTLMPSRSAAAFSAAATAPIAKS